MDTTLMLELAASENDRVEAMCRAITKAAALRQQAPEDAS